ncbi:transmembrane channel-like protein 8 isoform X2 [Xenopus laevis]|uniref:Transmembrane channel-like protein n=1 Tax=Xenopus laevis TaxID=8355 RepID=A0A8J1LQR9_XENLA|nr:transmembrane channel-like protein 8 isoform X2 [Xenopus laevis]
MRKPTGQDMEVGDRGLGESGVLEESLHTDTTTQEQAPMINKSSQNSWSGIRSKELREHSVSMQEKRCLREKRSPRNSSTTPWRPWAQQRSHVKAAWEKAQEVLSFFLLWDRTLVQISGKFGTGINSYFLFLRFLILLNVLSFFLTSGLIIIPTILSADSQQSQDNKDISSGDWGEERNSGEARKVISPVPYLSHFSMKLCDGASEVCLNICSQGVLLRDHPVPPHDRLSMRVSPYNRSVESIFLDIFTGEGFLENSLFFYGYYNKVTINGSSFNIRLAYLLTPLSFLLVCGLHLLRCTIRGLTLRRVRRRDYRTRISTKVFSGWDFCVQEDENCANKQQMLSNEFKSHLEEERWHVNTVGQPLRRRLCILTIRVLLNCISLTFVIGAFYCVHLATGVSQESQGDSVNTVLELMIQYLVPIVISLVHLILPPVFTFLVKFEGHSPSMEVNLTLIRCLFLRLGTLAIFLFSLGQKILCLDKSEFSCSSCSYSSNYQCWETSVGQEFYKLSVFHFLKMLMEFLLLSLPLRFMASRYQCWLISWLSQEQFQLPLNVLDMVYGQTLVWGGLFYVPLLSLLNIIFIFITFYVKKYYLYHLCDAPQKLFRESTSRIFFYFALFLSLMTIYFPLIYMVTSATPSPSCGLFTNHNTSWEAVQNITRSALPATALTALEYFRSDLCAYALLFVLSLLLTFYISQVRQYEHIIELLKDNLSNVRCSVILLVGG